MEINKENAEYQVDTVLCYRRNCKHAILFQLYPNQTG